VTDVFSRTPIIDSDSHVSEPADLWTSRLPAKWADAAPRPVFSDKFGESMWAVGGDMMRGVPEYAQAGWPEYPPSHPRTLEEADPASFEDLRSPAGRGRPECTYHPGGRSACALTGTRESAPVRAL
jgi:hypothetical protein